MKICGIICEYNPFHNGHQYQIQKAREAGATHVAAVMSGSFLQRGDIACFSKWVRVKAALRCGCDLVIELPTAYSLSSAERFATGAAQAFESMGCVDILHFGSESGSIEELMEVARICELLDSSEEMRRRIKQGENHGAARQALIENKLGPEAGRVLCTPNNTLGVEYLKALHRLNSPITPQTVRRRGAGHDSTRTKDGFASATYLRELLRQGRRAEFLACVPEDAVPVYQEAFREDQYQVDYASLEAAILYSLRIKSKEELSQLPDVKDGLENRLYQNARWAKSLDEFLRASRSKRHPLSRIRRIAMCSLLNINAQDALLPPSCLRVLGMNRRGMEILKRMQDTATVPYGTSYAKLLKAGGRLMEIDCRATDLYALFLANRGPSGLDYTTPAVIETE